MGHHGYEVICLLAWHIRPNSKTKHKDRSVTPRATVHNDNYLIMPLNATFCPGGGGGGYMTCGWTGVCRPVFRKVPSSNYRKLPSYPLL